MSGPTQHHDHADDQHGGHDHGGHDHGGHDHGGAHAGHDHGHDHGGHSHGGHSHGGHSHGPGGHHHGFAPGQGHDLAFAVGIGLNSAFIVAEVIFGLSAHSVALLADAAHNFGDVLGLLLAWGADWLTRRPPSARRTFGWGRSSILASLVNAAVLLIGVGAIAVEALQRLFAPAEVGEVTVMIVAAVGILINGASALLFMRGRESDLNIRASFVHLAGDAAVSAGVVVAAAVIGLTGWLWLDPLTSLAIAALIGISSWGILRESMDLAMDAVPQGVRQADVAAYLAGLPGVREVHDLHIWGLSTTQVALTVHLVCEQEEVNVPLHDVAGHLKARFGIGHATVQVETEHQALHCVLRPQDVI